MDLCCQMDKWKEGSLRKWRRGRDRKGAAWTDLWLWEMEMEPEMETKRTWCHRKSTRRKTEKQQDRCVGGSSGQLSEGLTELRKVILITFTVYYSRRTEITISKGKTGKASRRDQAPASSCLFQWSLADTRFSQWHHGTATQGILPTRQAHLSPGVQGFFFFRGEGLVT